jgi:hypothetical protein
MLDKFVDHSESGVILKVKNSPIVKVLAPTRWGSNTGNGPCAGVKVECFSVFSECAMCHKISEFSSNVEQLIIKLF